MINTKNASELEQPVLKLNFSMGSTSFHATDTIWMSLKNVSSNRIKVTTPQYLQNVYVRLYDSAGNLVQPGLRINVRKIPDEYKELEAADSVNFKIGYTIDQLFFPVHKGKSYKLSATYYGDFFKDETRYTKNKTALSEMIYILPD